MLTPFLKWAGGKTQLLDLIIPRFPKKFGRYYEPFVGGGAVFLATAPERAFVNDVNPQLINIYLQIKDNVKSVVDVIDVLDASPCDAELYYEIRQKYNEKIKAQILDEECAAFFVWLNKHCFNGLYRVNNKGFFNVSYNNKVSGKSINKENALAISAYLQKANVNISCLDFEEACEDVKRGDFVYFDSPYVPKSKTADFTDYTKTGFELADHQRLAKLFQRLDKKGVKIMLSNNDVPLIYELYSRYNIQSINVRRNINRDSSKRTGQEVVITNYAF